MKTPEDGSVAGMEVFRGRVLPEWIDVNDHMNVAYYVLAFDLGVDALWQRFGITDEFITRTQSSTFAVECHVTYQAELLRDDAFLVTTQILAYDQKRIHQLQRMYRDEDASLVATCEWMNLHVDLGVRKVAPWPTEVLERIGTVAQAQNASTIPAEAGRRMSVRNPMFACHPEYAEQSI